MLDASDEAHYFTRIVGEDNLFNILHPVHTSTPPIVIGAFDTLQYDAECSSFAAQLVQPQQDQTPVACSVIVTSYRVIIIACHTKRICGAPVPAAPDAPANPRRLNKTRGWSFERPSAEASSTGTAEGGSVPPPSDEARALYHSKQSHAMVFTIPHMSVDSVKVEGVSKGGLVTISCKHFWQFKVLFSDVSHGSRMVQLLNSLQAQTLAQLPAFDLFRSRARGGARSGGDELTAKAAEGDFGWSIFQEEREFERQLTQNYDTAIPQQTELHDVGRAGQGLDLRPWFRITTLGEKEPDEEEASMPMPITPFITGVGASPTYPVKICVPSAASDKFLTNDCLGARSRARIPAVSYVNLRSGAVLCRASQPLSMKKNIVHDGKYCNFMINHYTTYNCKPREEQMMTQVASAVDRRAAPPSLLDSGMGRRAPPSLTDSSAPQRSGEEAESATTAVISSGARHLNIIDCRPKSAAMGNQAVGGGVESYDFCRVGYYNIENIHAVNSSFAKMKNLILNFHGRNQRQDFTSSLQETGWFLHLSCLLTCAEKVVTFMERGESCLVHCTDGWDRTSQICALAMILQDPYYRTVRGFACLVEKEFAGFGHKFAERLGHMRPGTMSAVADSGVSASDVESQQATQSHKQQPSPVFPQFLDAMHQLLAQFPSEFEFTDNLLCFLTDHAYSCYYGTFLCNAHKERLLEGITTTTNSIWTDVLTQAHLERVGERAPFFLQPLFKSEEYAKVLLKTSRDLPRALRLNSSSKNLSFWDAYYQRDDPDHWHSPANANYRTRSAEIIGLSSNPALAEKLPAASYTPWDEECSALSGSGLLYHSAFVAWNCDELAIMQAHRRDDSARQADIRKAFKEASVVNRQAAAAASATHFDPSPAKPEGVLGALFGGGAGASKHCWICHTQFGLFTTKYLCAECKAPVCSSSNCSQTDNRNRRLCRNCHAIAAKH